LEKFTLSIYSKSNWNFFFPAPLWKKDICYDH
jgi:hypothetical protein